MRVLPRSLLGQVMLALAAALLIAQAISAVMLYRAASERREFALSSAASFQLLVGQRREARGGPDRELRVRPPRPRGGGQRATTKQLALTHAAQPAVFLKRQTENSKSIIVQTQVFLAA